jgi:hypothetical protein
MRWQLGGDWPVGARCIPAATIISAGEAPNYQAIPLAELPKPLPLNAEALDEDAALQMLYWHPPELWHQIKFVAGIDRTAVIARRWGRR